MKIDKNTTGNTATYPRRVLHVVGGMDTGGVETWLMHVLRRIDRAKYRFDFLTHTTKPCFYDEEIRSLGCRILPCLHPSRPWQYARNFLRIIHEYGPYDVVHSHVHYYSGFPLMLARKAGVAMRIAHSHNETSWQERHAGFFRNGYLRIAQGLIRRHATAGLACSRLAAVDLFGKAWGSDPRWRILHYGIDLEPFSRTVGPAEVRQELGIPADSFVVGHVGRFVEQKNHDFLLDIFAEVARRRPNSRLLLIGEGPLREAVSHTAGRFGLADKVIFAGVRPDVPRLMMGAMDVFVFPSRYEGLGIVLLEAQAAGLPVVMSDAVPPEAVVSVDLVNVLSLRDAAGTWARRALDCRQLCGRGSKSPQFAADSNISSRQSADELCNVYSLPVPV